MNEPTYDDLKARLKRAEEMLRTLECGGADAVLSSDGQGLLRSTDPTALAQKLRDQQFYSRSLLEASLDPLVTINAEGKITDVNDASAQATGFPREQLVGTDFSDYFTDPTKAREGYQKAFSDGFVRDYPLAIRHASGRVMEVLYNASVYRDDRGSVLGVFAAARDVTRQKQLDQQLQDQQFYSRSLLEASLDPLVTINAEGKITDVNDASVQATGFPREQLVGTDFSDYFTDPTKAREGYQKVFSDGLVRDYPLAIRHASGRVMDVLYNASVYRDGKGSVLGVFAAARDVTQQKLLDQQLREKNAELEGAMFVAEEASLAKSDFLSSMSHELRTPLNAILGFAQLLETGTPPPTPVQVTRVTEILKAGWYLLNLINEILDLALIESGKSSLSLEPVSVSNILLECHAMFEPMARESNAIKYNSERGTVEVSCSISTPGRLRIDVKDSGAGLSAGKLAQLFQPFNRLGQENGIKQGTGIGLAVSKKLAEMMGGTIGVESAVGVGSEFWIELERDVASRHSALTRLPEGLGSQDMADAAPYTLLYVEDNPANLMLVEQIIEARPHVRLLSARDGARGVALAREQLPDVILMDINLPGISGMEAMILLRKDPTTKHIPIIALSANAMARDVDRGLEAGFFRYLTKPIKISEFTEALDAAMASVEMKNRQRKA
jgi:PAS domain S-box-containing protein